MAITAEKIKQYKIVDDDNNNNCKTEKRENYKRQPTITDGRRTKTEGVQERFE